MTRSRDRRDNMNNVTIDVLMPLMSSSLLITATVSRANVASRMMLVAIRRCTYPSESYNASKRTTNAQANAPTSVTAREH
jgi:hypothetical protein